MFYINNEINTNTVHVYQFLFTDKYEIPLLVHCNKVTINFVLPFRSSDVICLMNDLISLHFILYLALHDNSW